MKLKRSLLTLGLVLPLLAVATGPADAHRRWLLPSATVLAGDTETVTVDAASSNGLFYFEHNAGRLDDLTIAGPDGRPVEAAIIGSGRYRSVFDVPLKQQGTYRIALASEGMFGSYMLNGERKRFRGSAETAKTDIPEGATEVRLTPVASRVETFVTLGAPNETALAPTGKGLEMIPVTHPNDLVTGEQAQMRFLVDGKPAAGLEIEFVKGDTRYRDDAGITKLTTDEHGVASLMANEPGMYYLEASTGGRGRPGGMNEAEGDTPARRASYTAVLEFLPG